MNITEEDQHTIIGALDSLGVALADHDHEWTEGERCIYEAAVECVLRANTQQCRLAASRGCAAAEGCAAPVAWKSITSSYHKQPRLVITFWCEQHAQILQENGAIAEWKPHNDRTHLRGE